MDIHSTFETLAEAWVAASTPTAVNPEPTVSFTGVGRFTFRAFLDWHGKVVCISLVPSRRIEFRFPFASAKTERASQRQVKRERRQGNPSLLILLLHPPFPRGYFYLCHASGQHHKRSAERAWSIRACLYKSRRFTAQEIRALECRGAIDNKPRLFAFLFSLTRSGSFSLTARFLAVGGVGKVGVVAVVVLGLRVAPSSIGPHAEFRVVRLMVRARKG